MNQPKISNLHEAVLRPDFNYSLPKGTRIPDSWEIIDNRIRGYYNDGRLTGIDWTHSTPVEKFEMFDTYLLVTTESGSVYTLYKDREIKRG